MRDTVRLAQGALTSAIRSYAALAAHIFVLFEMRCEALLTRLRRAGRKPRVIATACWHFPIYSQAFVYREVTELARSGFKLKFVYSELASRSLLASECSLLWRMKRRLVLSDRPSTRDFEHYRRRMPERVNALIEMIGAASGLTPAEIVAHPHFRQAFSFTRLAECWKADYIHSYFFYERTLFALVASHLLGIPRGITCYADHMLSDYPLKLAPLHLTGCAVVVATSARIKRELEALAGRELPNAIVKPNAIDTRLFARNERAAIQSSRPCRVVSISRIHPKKGLVHLVNAAALLRDEGMRIEVQIVGEPDPHDRESRAYHDVLKQRIAASGLESVVSLEGRKDSGEVRRCLAESDIFAAPYVELPNADKDGIPTALLEAMAAGCAIVTTDAGSVTEAIDHSQEGFVVPQRDEAALANAIGLLVRDERLRARMSRAAVERVRRQFDVRSCEPVFHGRVRAAIAGRGSQANGEAAV